LAMLMGKVRTRTDSEKKEEKSSGKTVGKLSHETGQKTTPHTHTHACWGCGQQRRAWPLRGRGRV